MKTLRPVLFWSVTLFVPLALFFLGIRVQLTHIFLEVEYRLPGFPMDPNGLPWRDRLQYSNITLDYLLNNRDISFLSNRKFPSGVKLFNMRELKHIDDVKNLVQSMLRLGYGIWLFILAVSLWAYLGKWQTELRNSLRHGGWLTVGLAAVIIVFTITNFRQFFTFFHTLFFAENSWRFLSDNTLLRLFPRRFWRDVFSIVCIIASGGGLGLGIGLNNKLSNISK
jgi:integral membrane protein (TIGR01906 family)